VSSSKVQEMMRSGDIQKIEEVKRILHPAVQLALMKLWNINKKSEDHV